MLLLLLLAALPVLAAAAARRGEPTLATLASPLAALRGLGRLLTAGWGGYGMPVAAGLGGVALLIAGIRAFRDGPRSRPVVTWYLLGTALLVALAGATSGLWVVAIGAAVAVAVVAAFNPGSSRSSMPGRPPLELLLGILVLAAAMRLVLITGHPVGFGTHGIVHLKLSVDLIDRLLGGAAGFGHPFSWMAYLAEQHGPMAVVNALGFAVFGVGFAQARLTQAVLGVATVWLAFLFGRRLFDSRFGLVLAFLIAVSPWHVAISRFNDAEHVLAPLQAFLALWAVLRADQERTRSSFVVAGFACALGWYVYATNQAFLLCLLGYLGWRLFRTRRTVAHTWRAPALFAVVFVAVSLPHVVTSVRSGHYLLIRSGYQLGGPSTSETDRLQTVSRGLSATLGTLYEEVNDPWFAKSSGGGLDAMVAALLPAGLLWCMIAVGGERFRDSAVLLLLWAGVAVLPAVLLPHVEFRRLLLAELLAQVLAAVILTEAGRLAARSGAGRRALLVVVPLVAVAWAAVATFTYWDRVTVFESRTSTYWVRLADDVREHLGKEAVVDVVPADGDQTREHLAAIRLGAFDRLRALARQGVPMAQAVRVVPVQYLRTAIRAELSAGRSVRVELAGYLARDNQVADRVARVVQSLDPKARRQSFVDRYWRVALVAWTVAPVLSGAGTLPP